MKLPSLSFVWIALALTACGNKDSANSTQTFSIQSQVVCNPSFVQRYDRVAKESRAANRYFKNSSPVTLGRNLSKLRPLRAACRELFRMHKDNIACEPQDEFHKSKYGVMQPSDWAEKCDAVEAAFRSMKVADVFDHQIVATVKDIFTTERLIKYPEFVLVRGNIGHSQLNIAGFQNGETSCGLFKQGEEKKTAPRLISGASMMAQDHVEGNLTAEVRNIRIKFSTYNLGLSCYKKGSQPFTTQEISDSLGDVIDLQFDFN